MAKRILGLLCGLLLCISLVGLVLSVSAKATLLNESNAANAIQQSGYVQERTAVIRETLAGFFESAGLNGGIIAGSVDEGAVETCVGASLRKLLAGAPNGLADTGNMFASVGQGVIDTLEADGSEVTAEGREQVNLLVANSEAVFAELTLAPMMGVIMGLEGVLGAGGGLASIVLCAALAVLAVCGIAWAGKNAKTTGLYMSSGLLGAGLALLVPALFLNGRQAALSAVMRLYYAPFYSLLVAVGAALALLGLVFVVVPLVQRRRAG